MNRGGRVGKYGCDARQDEDDECDVELAAGARVLAKDNIEDSVLQRRLFRRLRVVVRLQIVA